MRGSLIIASANPKGVFCEGTVVGALYPGIMVEIEAAVASTTSGRFSWQPYGTNFSAATGDPRLTAILREDQAQGGLNTQAYVTGTRCFIYCPLPGEEMNVLYSWSSGTVDTTVGERLEAIATTGLFQSQGTSANPSQFSALEAQPNLSATTLTWSQKS